MFRNKLMQILYNKYGNDGLNMFLLILMIILAVVNLFIHSRIIYMLQTLCFVFYLVRFFSTNHYARRNENEKFMKILNKIPFKHKANDFNTVNYNDYNNHPKKEHGYKYFKCPNCKAKLRVPKHKGKITITCPKCRTSFKGKS